MPTAWHYTTFLDFLDRWQSLEAGLIALVAAGLAVYVTIRLERWKAKAEGRDELLKEVRATNTANMLAFSICNTALNYKKQHIKPLKDKFDREKEQTRDAIEKQQSGSAGTVEFQADFRTLPLMVLPLSALQTQIFDRISVGSRPIALLTTLAQAADGLNNAIMKRNQLIEYFKSKSLPSRQLLAMYFGFPKLSETENLVAIHTTTMRRFIPSCRHQPSIIAPPASASSSRR